MATKYADFDLASGNNDGSSWANAWRTMTDAIAGTNSAPPAAGDTVYCRGTDTLASAPVLNLAGTLTAYIRWIGVNASGTNDGTRAVLNANGGNFQALLMNAANYNYFENFRFTGSGNSNGVQAVTVATLLCIFNNCSFDSNAGFGVHGLATIHLYANIYLRCTFYGNASGFYAYQSDQFFFCSFHDNTSYGFQYPTGSMRVYGCVFYDNACGAYRASSGTFFEHCVFDGNSTEGFSIWDAAGQYAFALGCRITNNGNGIDGNQGTLFYGWSAFDGNTDHILDGAGNFTFNVNGVDTNSQLNENGAGGGDTLQGYVSTTDGSEDYSTNYVSGTDPHIRRTAITIPTS